MCEQQEIKSFAFMDIETTGLPQYNFGKVNITEISIHACLRRDILWCENDKIPRNIHKLTLCFNPLKMIDPEASRISGFYNDILEPENAFNNNAGNLIINFLKHLQYPVCLVAHNGFGFDFPILKKSLEKIDVKIPEYILCLDSLPAIKRFDEIQTAREMLKNIDKEENMEKNVEVKDATVKCKDNENIEHEDVDISEKNPNNDETDNEDKKTSIERDDVFQKYLQKEYEEIVLKENTSEVIEKEKKIDWQKLNETTPKRVVNKNLDNKRNCNNNMNLPSEINTKTYEFKSRRKLFTPSNSKTPLNKISSPYSLQKHGYYKLSSIYDRIFGEKPKFIHHAEDDVCTLRKIAIAYGEDFVQYADENAIKFLNISTNGFR